MQNIMATLCRSKKGMKVHDIREMRYSFVFFHKMIVQKVIDGGPWSFEQATLILYQLAKGEDPNMVKITVCGNVGASLRHPKGFFI